MANGNNNGTLKIRIISEQTAYPVTGAVVSVASTGTPDEVIEELQTAWNHLTTNHIPNTI